jgi:hypothetical protein
MSGEDGTFSMEARDALGQLKDIVRGVAAADKIEAHAMRFLGESQEMIDRETRELFEALRQQSPPVPHGVAFGLVFALRAVIYDRIREIEDNAS